MMRAWSIALLAVLTACRFERQAAPADSSSIPGPGAALPTTLDSADSLEADAIRAELTRYYADFSARDWNRFADHFWPGATMTTVWQQAGAAGPRVDTFTIPEFVARAPEGPGSKQIFEEKSTSMIVRQSGTLAQVWSFYTVRFGDPGAVQEWQGVDAFTLLKYDGRWRIVSLAYGDR